MPLMCDGAELLGGGEQAQLDGAAAEEARLALAPVESADVNGKVQPQHKHL